MRTVSKYGFKCGAPVLSFLFLSHLFVLEKYRNGFLEYDLHFFVLLSLLLSICLLVNVGRGRTAAYGVRWNIDALTAAIASFVFYLTLSAFLHPYTDIRYVVLAWLLFISFCLFKYSMGDLRQLSVCFILMVLSVEIVDLADVQFFPSIYFLKGGSGINSGENANYYASILPFVFSMLFEKKQTLLSKVIFSSALLAFLIAIYLLFSCQARTAFVGAFSGIALVVFRTLDIGKMTRNMALPFYWKGAIAILLFGIVFWGGSFLYELNANSVKGRILIYEISLQMAADSPIFGHGPQSFKVLYNLYQSDYLRTHDVSAATALLAGNNYYAFNEFIQILVEFGAVGLLISVVLLGFIWFYPKAESGSGPGVVQFGALGSLLSIGVTALSSYPFHTFSILINIAFYLAVLAYSCRPLICVNLKRRKSVIISMAGVLFCLGLSLQEYDRAVALRTWEKSAHLALIGNFDRADSLYKTAEEELCRDGDFLYNYGSESFIAGNHVQGFALLKRAKSLYSSTDLYLFLGDHYKAERNFASAERCYQIAEYIQPAKFRPKIRLLLLYQEYGSSEQVMATAKKIVDFPVKIPSAAVEGYKEYAEKVLGL